MKKDPRMLVGAVLASIGLGTAAHAASVQIDLFAGNGGSSYTLNSGSIPGVIDPNNSHFNSADLNVVHQQIHNSGISTDGMLTILLAETNAGLTLMGLVDDNSPNLAPVTFDSMVGVSADLPGLATVHVNDADTDIQTTFGMGNMGLLNWDSQREGDAVAFGNLMAGDTGAMQWQDLGATGLTGAPVQLLSWTGQSWDIAGLYGFDETDRFSFMFAVGSGETVPVPPAAALALAGLLGVGVLRRRKIV